MGGRFYITTPIYYVNDVPHIGHAYTTLAADVLARYHKLLGDRVFFLTGTDEHGLKVQRAAEAKGINPKELADENAEHFKRLWEKMDISYNDFIRTTEERHKRAVSHFISRMQERGDIYLGEYEDWYCTPCETYWTETQLDSGNLCPSCHRQVERLKEPTYFFRMSNYQSALLRHLEEHPEFIQPAVRFNEIKSFVESGLRDLSISRTSFDWGVPIPGAEGHITYVWVDALVNYISALGYPDDRDSLFSEFWPADVHLIGKDILRHHTVYWPCFLLSVELELPKVVFAHGWWTNEGQKMSKSLGNFIDPHKVIDEFGLDPFRYFLLREVAFGQDGDFSFSAFKTRINADLANDLGNLLSRLCAMLLKYNEGRILAPGPRLGVDEHLEDTGIRVAREVHNNFKEFAFHKVLSTIWELVSEVNRYIDITAPWSLAKDSAKRERLNTVLYYASAGVREIFLLLYPFMPASSSKAWNQLGIDERMDARPLKDNLSFKLLKPQTLVKKGPPLFPRIAE